MVMAMAFPTMAALEQETARIRPDFTIVIDGQEKNFKRADGSAAHPLVYDGSTYLPLRAIGQIMDKTVEWNNNTKTVTLKSSGYTVTDADSFGGNGTVTDADSFGNNAGNKDVGLEKAKKIALNHAGLKESDVRGLKVEKDFDDGVPEYEVEFESGRTEYDYEIDAKTGKILKADKEIDD